MTDQMQALYRSLFLVEENQFWFDVGICLAYVLLMFFHMHVYVYGCKYCHELSYKSPISGMGVILLWLLHFHVVVKFFL